MSNNIHIPKYHFPDGCDLYDHDRPVCGFYALHDVKEHQNRIFNALNKQSLLLGALKLALPYLEEAQNKASYEVTPLTMAKKAIKEVEGGTHD